jgi:hypothetical protein
VLEVVTSEDLWICHCFFGQLGYLSDNMHLFARLVSGDALACNYNITSTIYKADELSSSLSAPGTVRVHA